MYISPNDVIRSDKGLKTASTYYLENSFEKGGIILGVVNEFHVRRLRVVYVFWDVKDPVDERHYCACDHGFLQKIYDGVF